MTQAIALPLTLDADLMLAVKAGDAACFDLLLARHRGPIVHFIYRMVQNGDIAFPGAIFCLSGRRIYGGQMAGMNVMRDTPRFITAMEKGQVDIGALGARLQGLTRFR